MSPRPSFNEFIEDELLRAPLALDQVVDAVLAEWQRTTPPKARLEVDPVRVLSRHRRELVTDAVRELRKLVEAEAAGVQAAKPSASGETTHHMELSLIDEDEVASDIEVKRAVEQVKLAAEFELRELRALTSALVDDVNVSRDTNPFRPDAYVRSLWCGVHALPLPRGLQATFMREAAAPLARTLRQVYAAACGRLEEQGVEPAVYRTIVVSAATRANADLPVPGAEQRLDPRDGPPAPRPPAASSAPIAAPPPAAPAQPPAADNAERQLSDLLTRLFGAIRDDPQLAPTTVSLVLRLQPTALAIAVREPQMLEAYEHALWRFIDAMAFLLESVPDADREPCLTHCRLLVDHLVADRSANVSRFEWASTRLAEFDRHLLERGIASAQPVIAKLQAAADTASMPLDVGSLDTVPADLLPAAPPAVPARSELRPGARLRVYLRGDWRLLQLLWSDPAIDVWLLRDVGRDRPWALRRRALDLLLDEQLAQPMLARSLVRSAAERVLKSIDPSGSEPG